MYKLKLDIKLSLLITAVVSIVILLIGLVMTNVIRNNIQEIQTRFVNEGAYSGFNAALVLYNNMLIVYILISISGIILAALGTLYVVRRVTVPLGQLEKAASAIGKGDLSQRIQTTSSDEIGLLATEYNRMIDSLQKQTREREKAEEARLKAEAEATTARTARIMMDSLIDPVLMLNPEGKITGINKGFTQQFGYGEEILGQTPEILVVPEEKFKVKNVIEEVKDQSVCINVDHTCITKDKRVFPILLNVSLIKDLDGQPRGIIGVLRDVSLKKKIEEKLLQTEERYHSALENMMEGCQIIGFDWKYIYINEMAAKHGRISRDALIGRTMTEVYPEIDKTEMFSKLRLAMEDRKPFKMENRFQYENGEDAWFDLIAYPVPEGLFILTLDITERKKAEEALAYKNAELLRSNAELQQFAYVASHDLQEPLRMIASYVQLIKQRYAGKLDQNADDFINYAVDGAKRMQVMIEELLQFSRIGTRGKPFQMLNTESIVEKVLTNLKMLISENQAFVTHDPLPEILGDEVQITQLFQNLISNGIKFRRQNPPEIHISAQKNGSKWIFSVRDNGIGIDSQYFDRIFIIFQRLHNRAEYPGNGIGLAICKKIVEHHGGNIWLESSPGKGTTFFFSFPLKEDLKNE